ncbi:hypothetical protein [Pseudonocardia humida]|uniref:Lipoprotein n=1 Tax=Pseudonocardia humida TaxID=2800819 RepID=A0ABT1A9G7_9PSEU|nr:hypothetical protein [Pseudonocardia humida]MCO1659653.1 hypothetical protein [Pseudonocardia humida]
MARLGARRLRTGVAALAGTLIISAIVSAGCSPGPEPAAPPDPALTTSPQAPAATPTGPPTPTTSATAEGAAAALPAPGEPLFPGRRLVALYGHPGSVALGALGEQDLPAAVRRAQDVAAQYQALVPEKVLPTFEIIATVASESAGADGDYSNEADLEDLRPWVEAVGAAGGYVLLDLQPGRADFLTQAQRYADLLAQPHVGLALDPEWRLRPDQRHRKQVGSVDVEEVNRVATWLADFTRDRGLPQKVLMVHQFRLEMIKGRERLDSTRPELAVVLHADGFGPTEDKLKTWNRLLEGAPTDVQWGWKNFLDEDTPVLTPEQTVQIGPTSPVVVTYQ